MAKRVWKSDKLLRGEPTSYQSHMADGIKYGRQAERARKSDPADAFELYHISIDAFRDALLDKPGDKNALERISRYSSQLDELPRPAPNDTGSIENTVAGVVVGVSFIFALDLLAPKITGNAIGSGNLPVDVGAGLLLLGTCIAATFFLFNKKSRPIPHPEKKKARKSRKKK